MKRKSEKTIFWEVDDGKECVAWRTRAEAEQDLDECGGVLRQLRITDSGEERWIFGGQMNSRAVGEPVRVTAGPVLEKRA